MALIFLNSTELHLLLCFCQIDHNKHVSHFVESDPSKQSVILNKSIVKAKSLLINLKNRSQSLQKDKSRNMDKIKINNQVILMRKHVKQAKVHTINKLTKQIKLLQNRKGDDAQIQKAKRKAERYLEEINLLKKMKPDYVSKQALSKAKDWGNVLNQKSSTIEDRCLAVLSNYESVQKEVKMFYSANPNLVHKIPDMVKEWEQKSQFPKLPSFKKRKQNNSFDEHSSKNDNFSNKGAPTQDRIKTNLSKNIEELGQFYDNKLIFDDPFNAVKVDSKTKLKEEKVSDVCQSENLLSDQECEMDAVKEINISDEVSSEDDERYVSHFSDDESENLGDPEEAEVKVKNLSKNNSKLKSFKHRSETFLNISKELAIDQDPDVKVDDKLSDRPSTMSQRSQLKTCVQRSEMPAENNLKTIAILNLKDLEGLDEIPVEKVAEDEEIEEQNMESDLPEMSSDPFFLKPEEYSEGVEKVRFAKQREKINKFPPIQDGKRMNRYERRNGRSKRFSQESETDFNFIQKKGFTKGKFQPRNQVKYTSDRYGEKKSHWSGKNVFKKLEQTSFTDFKKQSLLDKSNKLPFKKKADTSFIEKKSSLSKNNSVVDKPLHPSWEAKRKQKELSQTSFQGKRCVFEY